MGGEGGEEKKVKNLTSNHTQKTKSYTERRDWWLLEAGSGGVAKQVESKGTNFQL